LKTSAERSRITKEQCHADSSLSVK